MVFVEEGDGDDARYRVVGETRATQLGIRIRGRRWKWNVMHDKWMNGERMGTCGFSCPGGGEGPWDRGHTSLRQASERSSFLVAVACVRVYVCASAPLPS